MSTSAAVERSSRIEGVYAVRFQRFADARGYFYESFRRSWIPGVRDMVQGNTSFSRAGVLRGMHYHLKQADLWSVPFGRVRAALYDLRPSSPTHGAAQTLDLAGDEQATGLYIPRGVAHGFCALEDSLMTYLVDEYYDGADELGIRWDDPALGIEWGLTRPAVLSERDARNPALAAIPADLRPR
jgi:dTDP-4-dehydrorhamnose 3,5-epimerase